MMWYSLHDGYTRRHWFSVNVPINFCDKFLCLFHILFLIFSHHCSIRYLPIHLILFTSQLQSFVFDSYEKMCLVCDMLLMWQWIPFKFHIFSSMCLLQCNCPPQWTGEQCEIPVHVCEHRCLNNGTCFSPRPGLAQCNCLPGFTGMLSNLFQILQMFSHV